MIFKVEVIEADPEEDLVYKNPFPRGQTLIAATQEGVESDGAAFVLRESECISFKATPGFVFYGRC